MNVCLYFLTVYLFVFRHIVLYYEKNRLKTNNLFVEIVSNLVGHAICLSTPNCNLILNKCEYNFASSRTICASETTVCCIICDNLKFYELQIPICFCI